MPNFRSTFSAREYSHVLIVAGLAGSLFFGVEWLNLPSGLSKGAAQVGTVSAQVVHSKWPQLRLVEISSGNAIQASCGRVQPLCNQLGGSSASNLVVWFTPSSLGEEPWIVAIESNNQVLLSEAHQQAAFNALKKRPAIIASIFLLLAVSAFLFSKKTKP